MEQLIVFIYKKFKKLILKKTIVFGPVILIILIYLMNFISNGAFLKIFNNNFFQFSLVTYIFSIMITGFYILYIFEKIAQSSEDNNITGALLKIGLASFSSCIYFALIYTAIYRASGGAAFQGSIGDNFISQFISFLYLSTIIFTVGFSDISPVGSIPRLIVLLEVVLGFITLIYAISLFTYFKKSFEVKSPFLINNKKSRQELENEGLIEDVSNRV